MIEDNKEEVGDGQGNAAYQLSFEVHLLSGLGRRGDLAGQRRPPGEPLRRREVALDDQLLDVAVRDVPTAPVPLWESFSSSSSSNAAGLWSPPVDSTTADLLELCPRG